MRRADHKIAAERKARKWNARIYETFPIRYWNAWLDEMRPHVFVQELPGRRRAARLAQGQPTGGIPRLRRRLQPGTAARNCRPSGRRTERPSCSRRTRTATRQCMPRRRRNCFVVPRVRRRTAAHHGTADRASPPPILPDGDALYALHQRNPLKGGRLYSLTRLVRFAWPEAGRRAFLSESGTAPSRLTQCRLMAPPSTSTPRTTGFDKLFQVQAAAGPETAVRGQAWRLQRREPVAGGLIARFQTSRPTARNRSARRQVRTRIGR